MSSQRSTSSAMIAVIEKARGRSERHFSSRLLSLAPMYLPKERAMMYATPISTKEACLKTPSSSSAPLSTKKVAFRGAVHFSARCMMSAENSLMLQNTVPNIMQTSSDEKEMVTGPIWNSRKESAMVRNTKEIVRLRRFVLE